MNIAYTYEVVSVDAEARAMEIHYESPGRPAINVGTRLPFVGESLDQVAAIYAPVGFWGQVDAPVDVPSVGASGSFTPESVTPDTLGTAKQRKLQEIAAKRYLVETGGVTFNGVKILTDRESQSQLTSALISLQNNLLSSINWKDASGTFVQLTITELSAIAAAVAQHVQASFDAEKQYAAAVEACATIEDVAAVEWV